MRASDRPNRLNSAKEAVDLLGWSRKPSWVESHTMRDCVLSGGLYTTSKICAFSPKTVFVDQSDNICKLPIKQIFKVIFTLHIFNIILGKTPSRFLGVDR